MYIKSIDIRNLGSIESFNYNFKFNQNDEPLPIVLVGKNGTGKTLALTNLLDSLLELKKTAFEELIEVKKEKLYKVSSHSYIREGSSYSNVIIEFKSSIYSNINYIDFMTRNISNSKAELLQDELSSRLDWSSIEGNGGFYKNINVKKCDKEFEENVFLYFPVHRYYEPNWVNKNNGSHVEFSRKKNYLNTSTESVIQENILEGIEEWILDVILDKYLYESVTAKQKVLDEQSGNLIEQEFIYYKGKNTVIQSQINEILHVIYSKKFDDLESARIGISSKDNGRTIRILIKRKNLAEYTISPTFFHLSSGESMLISMFLSILKSQDKKAKNKDLKDIEGIVIIDEIDSHLHIALAKEILPLMMKKFPKIQFVLSSHSPFFLLGMESVFKEEWQMVDMSKGMSIELNSQDEIEEAYKTFIDRFDNIKESMNLIEDKLFNIQKTLVVTEGKTDWKHIKRALKYFQDKGEFLDLDIEFWEYEEVEMGEVQLETLLKENSKLKKPHKIIGIFDRDAPKGRAFAMERFKYLNNNVYGFSIPVPKFREYHQGICIEMLYEDSILNITNSEGRKIYLSSEFDEKTARHIDNKNIIVTNLEKYLKGKTERSKEIIMADGVIDEDGKSLVLTKSDFANAIITDLEPFVNLKFEGFRGVFEVLKEIEVIPLN